MPHISVSSQTTLLNSANFFVLALYDASAPTVLLESIAPAKPYGNPLQVTFSYNCLNGHIYIIKLWESVDSSATGTVRNNFKQTISLNSVEVRLPEFWEVDVTTDLVNGVNTFEKADIENWELNIERIGQGTMTPDSATDITLPKYKRTNSDDSPNDLGPKITLLTADDVFQPGEQFLVTFVPQIVVAAPGGTPSDPFSTGRVITADETLTNADLSQALMIQSATSKITITLPALSTVGDFRFMYFYSCGGLHKNATFACQGSDKIAYPTDKSSIVLGQAELLVVYKGFGKWQVTNDLFGVKMVGELLYNYNQTELNTLFCNGSLKNRDEYPRLWEWVQSLASGVVVSDSVWSNTFVSHNGTNVYTKKSCFSTGDGSTTFRLPLLTNALLRGIDGSVRNAASIELDELLKHGHRVMTGGNGNPANPAKSLVRQNYNGDGYSQGVGTSSNGPLIEIVGGDKNIMENSGAYLLIRC